MPSFKRLNGVAYDIAHHALSGLSYLHPHLAQACRGSGRTSVRLDLLREMPLPDDVPEHEPLRLASQALHGTFVGILQRVGFALSDLNAAHITFYVPPDAPDDYSYVSCDSEIVAASGKAYSHSLPAFLHHAGVHHG